MLSTAKAEIGDPGAYLLPDVSCDFRQVRVEQLSPERVRISGAQGRAPTATYKVSATQLDGYRCAGMMVIVGMAAAAKARRTGEAIVERTREILRQAGLPDYSNVQVELFGCESLYGANARTQASDQAGRTGYERHACILDSLVEIHGVGFPLDCQVDRPKCLA